ncbi:reverse transcriptase [Phytophthora megakarya]|uniref:Reverse transcriptase n=1 Tax=Phytophthora megakarya TaxID=4795 RepID=A0A225WSR6_9STRA|nr:reverse transcriptase [Phytophthora megakarya]
MPFGLKNAPQIYQRLLDNALYGFLRTPPTTGHRSEMDMFQVGHPEDRGQPSVLGRRSYIDDIFVAAGSWDHLCERVTLLLEACNKWNLSISVEKSFWGLRKVDYLGHRVSDEGLEAHPKNLKVLTHLPFSKSLRAMQPFLGSLNYYSRFVEDMAIYASVLYELREVDFAETRDSGRIQGCGKQHTLEAAKDPSDPGPRQCAGAAGPDDSKGSDRESTDPEEMGIGPKRIRAEEAFATLKANIATTPILQHFDPSKQPEVFVYANEWDISASFMQDHDGTYMPVMFTSRTLKQNELNYGVVEKEVLALLRMLDLGYSMSIGKAIKVLTRHSTLASLFKSAGLEGQLSQWAALLSPWSIEVTRCSKGEDEILGALAANQALAAIVPRKEPRRAITAPVPTVRADEKRLVASFDGSARVKRGGGVCSAVIWKLPEWTVVKGVSRYADHLTGRIVICGESNLVIRQMRGEIDCKAPSLTVLPQKAQSRLREWPVHDLVQVKREWNASADGLASAVLQRESGVRVKGQSDLEDLITLNRLDEILIPVSYATTAQINAVTRRSKKRVQKPTMLDSEVVQQLRVDRIRQA